MREAKALARSCVHKGSSEPLSHANVIRTMILCADEFIVQRKCDRNFIADHNFIFLTSIIISIVKV